MLKKKNCNNCNKKVKSSYDFCPNCGFELKKPSQNWGMLGKNDSKQKNPQMKMFGAGITGGIINKIASKMINELSKSQNGLNGLNEKDLNKTMKQLIPGVKIIFKKNPNNLTTQKEENTKFLPIEFNKNSLEKWKTLNKKEPKSNLKRIENKIKYEIEVPEVDSIKDVSIIKLENSLEVRAIGKKEAYLKQIQIDLPLKKYSLLRGILTLEMDATD